MQHNEIPTGWYKPKQERLADAIDQELFAIAKVHRDAMEAEVGLPPFIYRLLREEFYAAQTISGALTPEERMVAIRLLRNRRNGESTLHILKRVFALRETEE